jgi:hypothetical protein
MIRTNPAKEKAPHRGQGKSQGHLGEEVTNARSSMIRAKGAASRREPCINMRWQKSVKAPFRSFMFGCPASHGDSAGPRQSLARTPSRRFGGVFRPMRELSYRMTIYPGCKQLRLISERATFGGLTEGGHSEPEAEAGRVPF